MSTLPAQHPQPAFATAKHVALRFGNARRGVLSWRSGQKAAISKPIGNIVAFDVLSKDATVSKMETVQFPSGSLLNEADKRNLSQFPPEFIFQLSESEMKDLVANCDWFKKMKHSPSRVYAFTSIRKATRKGREYGKPKSRG